MRMWMWMGRGGELARGLGIWRLEDLKIRGAIYVASSVVGCGYLINVCTPSVWILHGILQGEGLSAGCVLYVYPSFYTATTGIYDVLLSPNTIST